VHVLVDPVQLGLEPVGLERERTEHPEPARVRDRGDRVAAMTEGEDRELDVELVADRCPHLAHSCRSAIGSSV
jgi:hypothetical protein